MNNQLNDWSRSYWVLILNQVFVLGPIALLTAAMLHESYQACEAASLELPGISEWYLQSIGPSGPPFAALISIGISFCAVRFRKRLGAVLIASVSFFGCIQFLSGAVFSSIAPLLVGIRNTLPPEQQW